jgi:hypothetical protein
MTAVLVLTGIVVVIIAAIVLLVVPVRHAEAVANGFSWHWSVRVGTRVWVGKISRRNPSGRVRYLQVYSAGGTGKRRYVYEKLVWRNKRRVKDSGQSQASLRMPGHVLRGEEQIRGDANGTRSRSPRRRADAIRRRSTWGSGERFRRA